MCSRVTRAHSQGGRGIQLCGPWWWQQLVPTPGARDGSGGLSPLLQLLKAAPCSLSVGTWRKRLFGIPAPPLVLLLFSRSVVSNSVTPWTAAPQVSLSFTIPQSLFELLSITSMMPSHHLIFCCRLFLVPSIFPSIRVFSNEKTTFASGGQSIGASASVLPMNVQD